MTPERWAQIEDLFHRAVECGPEHRTALLDQVCSDDPELRREVEALLSCDGSARDNVQAAVRPAIEEFGFPLTGQVISHYWILDGLGGGGMGLVYRAEDIRLGRLVALKFLPEELGSDPRALERFSREARAASSLDHPNICSIYEFGEHEGRPFMVMPLLEGQTLRERLAAGAEVQKGMPLGELLDIGIQVSEGLQAAHEKGIIHRDIKPANIFITSKGVVKILDFGLAKLLEASEQKEVVAEEKDHAAQPASRRLNQVGLTLTRTDVAMGTAGYMSPEQVRGEKIDVRTDLFSFGVVLYEMATGDQAFTGETAALVREAIVSRARELNPAVSPQIDAIINKALEKDRNLRYQSAAEIRTDLHLLTRHSLFAGALTDKDLIVLADFANNTDDPVFDNTLKEALAIDLGQSPFLNILSDFRVNEILKLMGRSAGDRITPDVGREICMRVTGKAVLVASITSLGSHYAVQLKATTCDTGDVLAAAEAEAGCREETLSALHRAASILREKLGESLASIRKFDKPLEEATTSSLEALKAYTLGNQVRLKGQELNAIPFYERATELDPSFAVAYAQLGSVYLNLSQATQMRTNFQTAFELRSRTSEKERFFIENKYYLGRGQQQKAIQVAEVHKQTYPREAAACNALAFACGLQGDFEKAAENFAAAIRLEPETWNHHVGLGLSYLMLDRLDNARDVAQRGLQRIGDAPGFHYVLSCVALAQGDRPTAEKETALAAASPQWRANALHRDAQIAATRGQLRRSQELYGEAIDFYQKLGLKEAAAGVLSARACIEATFGYLELARRDATAARALLVDPTSRPLTAIALVLAGEENAALALATDVEEELPEDSIYRLVGVSLVRALVAIRANNPHRALAILEQAKSYDGTQILVRYTRGEAFLQVGQEIAAESEFQAVLGPRMKNLAYYQAPNTFVRSLALLKVAPTYTAQASKNRGKMADLTHKARAAYQDFLSLWKDADPDIPIYQQAKAEYAKLQ